LFEVISSRFALRWRRAIFGQEFPLFQNFRAVASKDEEKREPSSKAALLAGHALQIANESRFEIFFAIRVRNPLQIRLDRFVEPFACARFSGTMLRRSSNERLRILQVAYISFGREVVELKIAPCGFEVSGSD